MCQGHEHAAQEGQALAVCVLEAGVRTRKPNSNTEAICNAAIFNALLAPRAVTFKFSRKACLLLLVSRVRARQVKADSPALPPD